MTEPTPPTPPRKQPDPNRWRRRIKRALIALIALMIVMRIVFFFAVGPVIRKVAGEYGFNATFDRQELTLLGGDVGLWGLRITPQSGGPPVFQAGYVRGYISTLALLRARLYIMRAEVDGADVLIGRAPDGSFPVLKTYLQKAAAAPTPATGTTPSEIDFSPPLRVEAFRLEHVRARIRDDSIQPPFETTLAMTVRVNDVGLPNLPTLFDVDIYSDPGLDSLRIAGHADGSGRNLEAHATVRMRGLHLPAYAGYLAPYGIRPVRSNIGADLELTLTAHPAPAPSIGVAGSLSLQNISVVTDEEPTFSLDNFTISADNVTATGATIGLISLNHARLNMSRDTAGVLQLAGLTLGGATAPSPSPKPAAPVTKSTAAPFTVAVREISIDDILATFTDLAIHPTNTLQLIVPHIGCKGSNIDPNNPDTIVPIAGSMNLPGIIGEITLTGQSKPFAARKTFDVTYAATGIRPDSLKPYLNAIGIESLLNDGRLDGHFSAALQNNSAGDLLADFKSDKFEFTDGQPLIAMQTIDLQGAGMDSQTGRMKIASLELAGPTLQVSRDSAGRVTFAHLRWTPPTALPVAQTPEKSSPTTRPFIDASALPQIEIDHFTWHNPALTLHDEAVQPAKSVKIEDAGADISNLIFDLQSAAPGPEGTIKAWLHIARNANVDLTGTTTSGSNSFGADLAVQAQNLRLTTLKPYLSPLQIEPVMSNGSFHADAKLSVAQTNQQLNLSAALNNVALLDGNIELAGVDQLAISDAKIAPNDLDIDSIEIDHPRAKVGRDPDTALTMLGLRILPSAPQDQPQALPTNLPNVALHDLTLKNADIDWLDRSTPKPAHAVAHANFTLQNFALGNPGQLAEFQANLAVDDTLEDLTATGTLDPNPDTAAIHAKVAARGIRTGVLAEYLPPGVELATKSGQFQVGADAALAPISSGGHSATLEITNLDWRDSTDTSPAIAMDDFKIAAPHIDLATSTIDIDQVTLSGFQAQGQLDPDGTFEFAGIAMKSAPPPPPPTTAPVAPLTAPPAPAPDIAKLVAQAHRPLPTVTLQTLDLNVQSISFRNLSHPKGAPLVLQNIRFRNSKPIAFGGKTAEASPPVSLELTGAISPLVGNFSVDLTAWPLAQVPAALIDVSAEKIRAAGVTDLMPDLADELDGREMTDGRFGAKLWMQARFDRRGPRDFDLSRGFQVDMAAREIAFRNGPTGPVLAGLKSIQAENIRVQPLLNTVRVKTLEISTIEASAFRDAAGVHAMGLIVKLPTQTSTQPAATHPASKPAAAPKPPPPPQPAKPPPEPQGEFAIDQLLISGIAFRYEDRFVKPEFVVPLNGLDVEVRGLSTLALSQERTIRFSAIVSADKVPLPVKQQGAGIPGAIGGLGEIIAHKDTAPTTLPMEDRVLFSGISVTGALAFYPKPAGYTKIAIDGVELASLQGLAKEEGVDLHGGVFDGDIHVQFENAGDMNTKARLVLTDLQVAEKPNGPISRNLNLPVPLDAAIGAIQDADGSITVPLDFPIKNDQISQDAITGAVAEAVSSIVATAIASAPVKLVGGVADLFGLGGDKKPKELAPITIQFAPGTANLDSTALNQLDALLVSARKDKTILMTLRQTLGEGDVRLMAERANPSNADDVAMIDQLQTRRLDLLQQRAQLAGQLRGQLLTGMQQQSEQTQTKLRDTEEQLGGIELATNELYDLLRPGAARLAARRTRAASVRLAQLRLDAVAAYIHAANLPDAVDRIKAISPQYNPATDAGGQVIIQLISQKH